MHYDVIFDVTKTEYRHWSSLLLVLIFAAIPIVVVSFRGFDAWRNSFTRILILISVFGAAFGGLSFYHDYSNYLRLQSAMRDSKCIITEGVITNFYTIENDHNKPGESIVVNGLEFRYCKGSAQNGFNQIGLLKNGMQVRIYHFDMIDSIDKDITRLEIAQ